MFVSFSEVSSVSKVALIRPSSQVPKGAEALSSRSLPSERGGRVFQLGRVSSFRSRMGFHLNRSPNGCADSI